MPAAANIQARTRRFASLLALTLACASPSLVLHAQTQAASYRSISGIVTDDGHEPLHGAVVELEDQDTHAIISYLTENDGHYIFKRVDSHTDYQIWATFRGHKSATHSISKFDDHLDKVIDIKCKTF